MGACAQARKVTSELQSRVGKTETFDRALQSVNKELGIARGLHRAAVQEAARLQLEVDELSGLRRQCEEARSELVRVKSQHAEEMNTAQRKFIEGRDRFVKEASEERARLQGMVEQSEDRFRKQTNLLASRDDRIKWDQATIIKLRDEITQFERENGDLRQQARDLRASKDQVKADKVRALGQVDELSDTVAQLNAEVETLQGELVVKQRTVETLQGELMMSQQRGSDFERRVTESEAQTTLLRSQIASLQDRAGKAEFDFALLKGAQDADCKKAFRFGIEETRMALARQYPELDLSFLEAEEFNARTPVAEASEDSEYEVTSDTEVKEQKTESLPGEAKALEVRAFEAGGPSHTSSAPATDDPEAEQKL